MLRVYFYLDSEVACFWNPLGAAIDEQKASPQLRDFVCALFNLEIKLVDVSFLLLCCQLWISGICVLDCCFVRRCYSKFVIEPCVTILAWLLPIFNKSWDGGNTYC